MRILFVRHGDPDYKNDCLTELGREQAEAVSRRLLPEGISEIYASPYGRAAETAAYTASRLSLPVTTLPYMHEIGWGGDDLPFGGHPWSLSDQLLTEDNYDFFAQDWRTHPYFVRNKARECYDEIAEQFDLFLAQQGFRHDGRRFFCTANNEKTIALFSHGGSGACAIGHILSLPFPFVAAVMQFDVTSVTIIEFPAREGEYIHPRLELFNDAAHIRRAGGPLIQREAD